MAKRVFGAVARMAEQKQREQEIHDRFLREQPGLDELVERGDPTVNTLQRYAFALGKQLVVQVVELPTPLARDAAAK